MQRLRSIWVLRVLVVIMTTSLLPTLLGSYARAAQPTSADAYADWLRDYLIEPSDPAVARALDAAAATRSQTFEGFLRVFVDAYEAQHPDVTLNEVFSVKAQSADALVRLLYGRYQQVLGGVPVSQGTITATPSALAGITDRVSAILPVSSYTPHAISRLLSSKPRTVDVCVLLPVRAYWAAYPQGP